MADLFHTGAPDLADDARRLLLELEREVPGLAATAADCRPPMDVFETASSLEVVLDVPGVAAESIRVLLRGTTLVAVGAKLGAATSTDARYHLAERSYGRFARAIRLSGAFDGARARAVVDRGQLRVTLPLVEERRGRLIAIPVDRA